MKKCMWKKKWEDLDLDCRNISGGTSLKNRRGQIKMVAQIDKFLDQALLTLRKCLICSQKPRSGRIKKWVSQRNREDSSPSPLSPLPSKFL